MQNEVIRLHHELGKTMVFITHDLSEALKLGDHVMIMRAGKVVQIGSPEELVARPADDYVEDFVRDIAKSHVLTLRWIMRDPEPTDAMDGPIFAPDAIIRTALHAAASTEKPIRVEADGQLLGMVDRARILESIAGADPEPDGPGAAAGDDASPHHGEPPRVEPVTDPTQETAEFLVENIVEPGSER
jgi:glycine betaine/proline transport system ATP-binding protein